MREEKVESFIRTVFDGDRKQYDRFRVALGEGNLRFEEYLRDDSRNDFTEPALFVAADSRLVDSDSVILDGQTEVPRPPRCMLRRGELPSVLRVNTVRVSDAASARSLFQSFVAATSAINDANFWEGIETLANQIRPDSDAAWRRQRVTLSRWMIPPC